MLSDCSSHLTFTSSLSQAIETSYGYGQWLHGEAVAAGTVLNQLNYL